MRPQGKEPARSPSLFRFQIHLTKDFPGFSLIEKSHDDPGILALQNGERNRAPEGCLGPQGLSAFTALHSCPRELSARLC